MRLEPQGQWSYVDRQGKTVLEAKYDDAHRFSGGVARVGKREGNQLLYGLINYAGEPLCDFEYMQMGLIDELGFCPVQKSKNEWGFLQVLY